MGSRIGYDLLEPVASRSIPFSCIASWKSYTAEKLLSITTKRGRAFMSAELDPAVSFDHFPLYSMNS